MGGDGVGHGFHSVRRPVSQDLPGFLSSHLRMTDAVSYLVRSTYVMEECSGAEDLHVRALDRSNPFRQTENPQDMVEIVSRIGFLVVLSRLFDVDD
jgi:hypothetical protein